MITEKRINNISFVYLDDIIFIAMQLKNLLRMILECR